MSPHTDQHGALLQAVAVGDLPHDAQEVARRRAECEPCAARLDGLALAAEVLAADRAEHDELLALAAEITDAPGEDLIEALRDHPEIRGGAGAGQGGAVEAAPPAWGPSRFGAMLALAAAAAFLAYLMIPSGGGQPIEPDLPPDRYLNEQTGDLRLTAPLGDVESFTEFTWTVDPGLEVEVGYYELVVRADGSPESTLAQTRSPAWTPPAAQPPSELAESTEIEWWVVAYDLGAEELARSQPGFARRSP